jgi:hypothetical protein
MTLQHAKVTAILSILFLSSSSSAFAAPPTPPCNSPAGIVPVLNESLCFTEVVPKNPSGIEIRQYGFPINATFVTGVGSGPFINGVQGGIASVLTYFSGANDEQRNILSARTTPFAVIPPRSGATYVVNMQVSPSQFPDDFLIPRPNPPVRMSRVADNIGLIAVFQFNTTGFPYLENCQEACGVIQNSTLPSGYAINTTSAWSPTYVFYNGQNDANYTSECWMAVMEV